MRWWWGTIMVISHSKPVVIPTAPTTATIAPDHPSRDRLPTAHRATAWHPATTIPDRRGDRAVVVVTMIPSNTITTLCTTTSATAAVTIITMIIITTNITTAIPEKSAAPLVITTIIRQLRLRSQRYVLRCIPSSWDVVRDWERKYEGVTEALNPLRRPQSPWTTLASGSLDIVRLTHTEREAVHEAVIDLTRTRLERAKSV